MTEYASFSVIEVSGRLSINKEVMEEDELQQCEPADDCVPLLLDTDSDLYGDM